MLKDFKNWIHHLLNPHCSECKFEKEHEKICQKCIILETQLTIERDRNKELLDSILNIVKPQVIEPSVETTPNAIRSLPKTWKHKERELRERERNFRRTIKEASEKGLTVSIEKLEEQVGIKENA